MNVWIDVDNAPHVQVFRPILRGLAERGASSTVTSRDRAYVPDLLDDAGIPHTVIGRGQPRGAAAKGLALAGRALGLARFASGRRFHVAIGHGSRALPVAARAVGVPNLTMFDYEHVSTVLFRLLCDRILVPRAVTDRRNGALPRGPWVPFDGLKEEVYLADFVPDPRARAKLGVGEREVLVVIRPPSLTAHYHDARSERVLAALLGRLGAMAEVRTVWLRREPGDPVPAEARAANVLAPDRPVDGPSLLAAADVAVSGGGTMIREAAVLGTPAYSIFTGPTGAVDELLIRRGRLTAVRDPAEIDRIRIERKSPRAGGGATSGLREFIVDQILELAQRRRPIR